MLTTSEPLPDNLTKRSAEDILSILNNGRSESIEWIDEQAPLPRIAALLTAMANGRGGTLIVGIEESNKSDVVITGVKNSEETIDRLLHAATLLVPPLITPLPRVTALNEKSVVVANIPAGMPHIYAFDGRYLQRKGIINEVLNPQELRRLFIERGDINFETEITENTTLNDLDWDKVNHYVKNLRGFGEISPEEILVKRGCLVKRDTSVLPTNAGILLFGKDPQRHLMSAEITAVRFAGETMSDTFSRQDISGTLPDQIRKTETFLIDHLRKGVRLVQAMERKEYYEYPMEAARELVVNAVAHRDYSIKGDNIRVFLFKNHMEVSSPGRLAGPITLDNIKDERFSRNPVIVQVLSDMGFIERLGYGVDRVIELMRQQDLQAPEFKETNGGFHAVLFNHPVSDASHEFYESLESVNNIPREYKGIMINPRQEAAITYLRKPGNSRITNSELQRLFPDVHAETIRRDLADLVTKNVLNKMGEKRGSYYVLKTDRAV